MRRFGYGLAVAALALLSVSTASAAEPRTANKKTPDIVDTAVAAGSFKTLAAALQAGGLVETLKGQGPVHGLRPHRRGLQEAARRHR